MASLIVYRKQKVSTTCRFLFRCFHASIFAGRNVRFANLCIYCFICSLSLSLSLPLRVCVCKCVYVCNRVNRLNMLESSTPEAVLCRIELYLLVNRYFFNSWLWVSSQNSLVRWMHDPFKKTSRNRDCDEIWMRKTQEKIDAWRIQIDCIPFCSYSWFTIPDAWHAWYELIYTCTRLKPAHVTKEHKLLMWPWFQEMNIHIKATSKMYSINFWASFKGKINQNSIQSYHFYIWN